MASHLMAMSLFAAMGGMSPEERATRRKQREQDAEDDRRYRAERAAEIEAVAATLRAERLARKRAAYNKRNS